MRREAPAAARNRRPASSAGVRHRRRPGGGPTVQPVTAAPTAAPVAPVVTPVAPVKPVPVIVTLVPPAMLPLKLRRDLHRMLNGCGVRTDGSVEKMMNPYRNDPNPFMMDDFLDLDEAA